MGFPIIQKIKAEVENWSGENIHTEERQTVQKRRGDGERSSTFNFQRGNQRVQGRVRLKTEGWWEWKTERRIWWKEKTDKEEDAEEKGWEGGDKLRQERKDREGREDVENKEMSQWRTQRKRKTGRNNRNRRRNRDTSRDPRRTLLTWEYPKHFSFESEPTVALKWNGKWNWHMRRHNNKSEITSSELKPKPQKQKTQQH